ncbi:MAG: hypothetical protein AABY13_04435 [Nanoarchaeota archaeon]
MAKAGSAWVCATCGNGVIVVKAGKNPKVGCCGKAMKKVTVRMK